MKNLLYIMRLSSFAAVSLLAGAWLSAALGDAKLLDPDIPNGEKIEYDLYNGADRSHSMDYTTISEENGQQTYRVNSRSRYADISLNLTKKDMVLHSAISVLRDGHTQIERKLQLQKVTQPLADNEIGVLDWYGLIYQLRGYPFEKPLPIRIRILGDINSYPMIINPLGRDKLMVNGKVYDCYHLTLSLNGILGKILAKNHFWFSASKPHYLVRLEGPTGGPGSPKRTVELISYSVAAPE